MFFLCSSTSLPILNSRIGIARFPLPDGIASLRKIGLAKWGEIQILPDMWPWHGDIPTVQRLVISLQLQKWNSVNRAFIHSVSVC